jgi:hypothetical protein
MMAATAYPEELIDEAVLRSSSPFALPPWTSSEKTKIWSLVVAPTPPNQTTGEIEDGHCSRMPLHGISNSGSFLCPPLTPTTTVA